MLRLLVLAAFLLAPAAARAQERTATLAELSPWTAATSTGAPWTEAERPPLSPGRVVGQLAAGVLGGAVGALALGLGLSAASRDADNGWGELAGAVVGVVVGYPIGATGGVYLAGRSGRQTGSGLATFAGSVVGALAGAALAEQTEGISYVALVPIGATVGFNLTRRNR